VVWWPALCCVSQGQEASSLTPGKQTPIPAVEKALGLVWTGAENLPPPTGFDPPTIQPVASRYTDWAVPAHNFTSKETEIRTISNVEEYEEWRFSLVYVHGTAVRVHFVANAAAVRQEDGAIADVCAASWMERGGPSETKIKLN